MQRKILKGWGAAAMCFGALLPLMAQAADKAAPMKLTALDYIEIEQLSARYAFAIEQCSNHGYDYADLYTDDGYFAVSPAWGDPGKTICRRPRGAGKSRRRYPGGLQGSEDHDGIRHHACDRRPSDHADADRRHGQVHPARPGRRRQSEHHRAAGWVRRRVRQDGEGAGASRRAPMYFPIWPIPYSSVIRALCPAARRRRPRAPRRVRANRNRINP